MTPVQSGRLEPRASFGWQATRRAAIARTIVGVHETFIEAPFVCTSQQIVEDTEAEDHTDPFDTHPALRDRLAALALEQHAGAASDARESASILIGDTEKHACALVEFALGLETFRRLKPIEWTAVGKSVYAAHWRQIATSHSPWLSRFTADALPFGKHAFIRLGSDLVRSDEQNVNSGERIARAAYVLAVGIGVLRLDDGWQAVTMPGTPVLLVRGSVTFDPFGALRGLSDELTTSDVWKAECHAIGIAGRPLGHKAAVHAINAATARTTTRVVNELPPTTSVDHINCYRYKHPLAVSTETRGKTVKCPHCGTKQSLPV